MYHVYVHRDKEDCSRNPEDGPVIETRQLLHQRRCIAKVESMIVLSKTLSTERIRRVGHRAGEGAGA